MKRKHPRDEVGDESSSKPAVSPVLIRLAEALGRHMAEIDHEALRKEARLRRSGMKPKGRPRASDRKRTPKG